MEKIPFIHMLKTPLNYYLFDVNTNQLIKVGEKLYNYLLSIEMGNESTSHVDIEIEKDIKLLSEKGFLSTYRIQQIKHSHSDLLEYHLNDNIEQITLQVTQNCNFRCAYCAYATSDFTVQRNHSLNKMSLEMALSVVDFFVAHLKNQKSVCIGFYGGEPFLEFDLIKKVVFYAEKELEGKNLSFTATTNGSLFTTEIMEFLTQHNFNLLISVDGTPELHDRSRKFAKTGGGTFAVIENNLNKIKEEYPELFNKLSINAVIDPRHGCQDLHEMFNNDILFRDIQSVRTTVIDDFFSIEKVSPSEEYIIENSTNLFKAYMALANKYPKSSVPRVVESNLSGSIKKQADSMIPSKRLSPIMAPGGPCIPGQRRLFVNTNGDFYPCERVSETSDVMKIGDIVNGFDYEKARKILNIGQLTEEDCKNCWAVRHCSTCARLCDNNGTFSANLKRANCKTVLNNAEEDLRMQLFERELC